MKSKRYLLIPGIILIITFMNVPVGKVFAADTEQENFAGIADEYCLSCYDTPGLTTELSSSEKLYVGIDPDTYYNSTHGELGYACVQCHTYIKEYPHPENSATTVREYTLQMYENCRRCRGEI